MKKLSNNVEMVKVNGQLIPLHIYLQSLNRSKRREFLADLRKSKDSKKITTSRVEPNLAEEIKTSVVPFEVPGQR